MIDRRPCPSSFRVAALAFALTSAAALAQAPAPASASANKPAAVGDAPQLPPPPTGATPASAMRLPNLPVLGDSQSPQAASAASPAAAPAPPVATVSAAVLELQRLDARSGLSDEQVASRQIARSLLARGDEAGALSAAQKLSADLDAETREFIVSAGQNLFSIAARAEVYANPKLWPLIWWANQPRLREAWAVAPGMHLKIPAHPSVAEVSAALAYSSRHNVSTARIDDAR